MQSLLKKYDQAPLVDPSTSKGGDGEKKEREIRERNLRDRLYVPPIHIWRYERPMPFKNVESSTVEQQMTDVKYICFVVCLFGIYFVWVGCV